MGEESIYIVFAKTTTRIGKCIRLITHHKYNHAILSLDRDLKKMYGFSRYHKNAPFVGGFTQESALRYINEKKQVDVKICEIKMEKEKYLKLRKYIEEMENNSDEYMYNIFSAATFPIHKKVKIKKAYICLEFIIHIINKFDLNKKIKEDEFYTIQDVEEILKDNIIYEGNIKKIIDKAEWDNDKYEEEETKVEAVVDTVKQVKKLVTRKIFN